MLKAFDEHYLLQAHCDGEGCRAYLNFQVEEGTTLHQKLNILLPMYNRGDLSKEELHFYFADFRQGVPANFNEAGWLGISNEETYCPEHKENNE